MLFGDFDFLFWCEFFADIQLIFAGIIEHAAFFDNIAVKEMRFLEPAF